MQRFFRVRLSAAWLLGLAVAGVTFASANAADEPGKKPAAAKAGDVEIDPLDWPHWRGPEQNGISREKGLVDKWDPKGGAGSNLIWKNAEIATRSTPIVMRGKLYTLCRAEPGTPREGEKVVCVDAATGEKIWENRFNVYLSDVPDVRVAWSCCVGDPTTGRVYALGVCGYFQCLDGETGKTIWSRSLHEEYGFLSTYGGRTNTPVIFEDMVLISAVVVGWDEMAKPAHRFMAFDKATGEMIWFNGTGIAPYDTTYSVPALAVIGEQQQLVFGSGDGELWGFQSRTGKPLWHLPMSRRGLNVSPLIVGDTVYMSHSEENMKGNAMGALLAVDGTGKGDLSGKEKWKLIGAMAGKTQPLLIDERLYVIDDGAKLLIYDSKSGEQVGKQALSTIHRSSPVYADGKIYTCTNNGVFYILQPSEKGVKVLQKLRLTDEESDGSPIVSHGRIYLPTSKYMYCIGKGGDAPKPDPIPAPREEPPVDEDPQPAQVQVVPCELLLAPGATQSFKVKLYNARGQFLKTVDSNSDGGPEFSVKGSGEITKDGKYTASATGHESAIVNVKVGELAGRARIRIVPPLPWKFDFNEAKDVPITWIGGRVRYIVSEVDGEKVIAKRSQIPTKPGQFTKLGTLSQLWMGPIDLKDYTMQADTYAKEADGKLPDIGLINQRYTLTLMGAHQRLQLDSWAAQLRLKTEADFPWKPNTWYTMKVSTEMVEGKLHVRGKVWPRGKKEPAKWTLETVDPTPNLNGAPGLYGNAKDAEFYLDNISVTPNK